MEKPRNPCLFPKNKPPEITRVRVGHLGLSKMLFLAHRLGGRKRSPNIVLSATATSPLLKAFFTPPSPPRTPPYLSKFCPLSAPFRRGTDFQHLSLLRAPHLNRCRTGLSSYHPHPSKSNLSLYSIHFVFDSLNPASPRGPAHECLATRTFPASLLRPPLSVACMSLSPLHWNRTQVLN